MTKNKILLRFVLEEAAAAALEAQKAHDGAKGLSEAIDQKIKDALAGNGTMPSPDELADWATSIRANEKRAQTAGEHYRDAHAALLALLGASDD